IPVSEITELEEPRRDSSSASAALTSTRSHQKKTTTTTTNSTTHTTGTTSTTTTTTTTATTNASRRKGKQSDRRGYSALPHGDIKVEDDNEEEEDEFEDAAEDSVMLKPLGASSSLASRSAPRRPVYSSNDDDGDDDNENEISVAPSAAEGSSSGAAAAAAAAAVGQNNVSTSITSETGATAATANRWTSGARTTNVSFLARLTGRQRPERDARRMLQSSIDGVFSNLSAKPRVEKPYEEELPPAYKSVALDVSPAYYETTVLTPGFADDDDMLLVDGLPVGGLFGFMWNMIISTSFQFVGFFLTYLLHTSHATKQGSKSGLGITFISIGYNMLNGRLPDSEDSSEDSLLDSDTGYMGNADPTPSS
ncbi:hypothetical protein BGZ65_010869, partial [Modicella reniformis]